MAAWRTKRCCSSKSTCSFVTTPSKCLKFWSQLRKTKWTGLSCDFETHWSDLLGKIRARSGIMNTDSNVLNRWTSKVDYNPAEFECLTVGGKKWDWYLFGTTTELCTASAFKLKTWSVSCAKVVQCYSIAWGLYRCSKFLQGTNWMILLAAPWVRYKPIKPASKIARQEMQDALKIKTKRKGKRDDMASQVSTPSEGDCTLVKAITFMPTCYGNEKWHMQQPKGMLIGCMRWWRWISICDGN